MTGGRFTTRSRHLQVRDLAGLAIDFSYRDEPIGIVDSVIKVTVQTHAAIMRKLTKFRRRPERPIGTVVVVVLGPDARRKNKLDSRNQP